MRDSRPARAWLAGVLSALSLLCPLGPAAAQTFDPPEGFVTEITRESSAGGGGTTVLRVHPEGGPFARLSTIELRQLDQAIDDPDRWLRRQMSLDMGDRRWIHELFDSPDSPFAESAFADLRDSLDALMDELAALGAMPLEFCAEMRTGHNRAGAFRELSCRFPLGPIKQYAVLRLQRVGGLWYYTLIRTMNERRLRHLTAIANSFHVE